MFHAAHVLRTWHSSQEPEKTEVVIGYWGQPPEMRECKHPFLIVPGYLKSSKGDGTLLVLITIAKQVITATSDECQVICLKMYSDRTPSLHFIKPNFQIVTETVSQMQIFTKV